MLLFELQYLVYSEDKACARHDGVQNTEKESCAAGYIYPSNGYHLVITRWFIFSSYKIWWNFSQTSCCDYLKIKTLSNQNSHCKNQQNLPIANIQFLCNVFRISISKSTLKSEEKKKKVAPYNFEFLVGLFPPVKVEKQTQHLTLCGANSTSREQTNHDITIQYQS